MSAHLRGCHLHIDCASGAAGDMLLGALVDLGVPLEVIGAALDAIGAGRQRLRVQRVVKHGLAAIDIKVDTSGQLSGLRASQWPREQAPMAAAQAQAQASSPNLTPQDLRELRELGHSGEVEVTMDVDDDVRVEDRTLSLDVADIRSLVERAEKNIIEPRPARHRHTVRRQGTVHDLPSHRRAHRDTEGPVEDPAAAVAPKPSDDDFEEGEGRTLHERGLFEAPTRTANVRDTLPASTPATSPRPPSDSGVHRAPGSDTSTRARRPPSFNRATRRTPSSPPAVVAPPVDHGHAHAHDGHHHDNNGHTHDHGDHGHSHAHPGDHAHVHYAQIREQILGAALTDGTKRRALDIFDRIARAEAKLHGMTVADVAFHEVGAIDSVVDIVGTAAALDWLSPASVTCASVAMGHGTVTCAHGVLPVPAPAALEVLREARGVMTDGGVARELCTPTGAAVLASAVTRWSAAPTSVALGIGWGAGDADLADRANVLRVTALDANIADDSEVWQIDANLDDMSPELCGPAAEAVFAAGALDVWWTPITMKKGRPALTLSALAGDAARDAVIGAILRETTTIGVRYTRMQRTVLQRSSVEVATRYGTIPVKIARSGDTIANAAPEYEACAAAARAHGVPVKLVYAAALAAFDHGQ